MSKSNNLSILSRFHILLLMPFTVLHIIFYLITPNRKIIDADIKAWSKYREFVKCSSPIISLIRLIILQPEFRSQFNLRIKHLSYLLLFFKGSSYNDLGRCPFIGPGFVLMHGFGTVINGSARIGSDCFILQGVTIGGGKGGSPIIGNNVFIGAGATIIGNIRIGNNVKIGAGAIVVSDVPDNSTVVCEKARIIEHSKQNTHV